MDFACFLRCSLFVMFDSESVYWPFLDLDTVDPRVWSSFGVIFFNRLCVCIMCFQKVGYLLA